jgi:two-component sensor histidine kinase
VFESALKLTNYIQSEESRTKAINRFCWVIVFLGMFYSFMFAILHVYNVAILLGLISASFRFFIFLNKKSQQSVSKVAIILTTNVGVFVFSAILGFNSGVYLYFFAAPMLIYLIYDFTQKRKIYLNLSIYLINFLIISIVHHFDLIKPIDLSDSIVEIIFNINFVFTFLLCFSLVIYFSNNNHTYISQLKQSNKEKDILLSEIHHRVKNNLAVISGLIELQLFYVKDDMALNVLEDSVRRIKTIGLLHEKLYNSHDYEKIEMDGYIKDLVEYVKSIYPYQSKKIDFKLNICQIELVIEEALPLSLILNELITNSIKYAFNDKESGLISIDILENTGLIKVEIKDNGCGFDIDKKLTGESLGINLIFSLSEQLGSQQKLTSDKNGTVYKLEFSPPKI